MPTEASPADEPQGWVGKFGAALPVALAAVATTFAGMSSSEMARAMFWRSAAAQDQAKATSQWTYAGFKRDRALITQAAAATLRAAGGTQRSADYSLPPVVLPATDDRIRAVLGGIKEKLPEPDLVALAGKVPFPEIDAAIRAAEVTADRFEKEQEAVPAADGSPAAQAARFEQESRRYLTEAKLYQGVSQLYEVRVRRTTAESERHRGRSENFFYAMLVAQVGATGSALALARKRRSTLWLFAGLTGLVSVAFGGYVYLTH